MEVGLGVTKESPSSDAMSVMREEIIEGAVVEGFGGGPEVSRGGSAMAEVAEVD